jgi:hypothetical protein
MNRLSADTRGVLTRFGYNMWNGGLAHPVLRDIDFRPVLVAEPSAAEQAAAIFVNVLELDGDGIVVNAEQAEIRAGQYIRAYCEPGYSPDPPLAAWETEREPFNRRSQGPMP